MSIPSQATVRPVLDGIRSLITTSVLHAWGDWLASDHVGVWRCNRSRANFVWEQIIDHAHAEFSGHACVHIINGSGTMEFLVRDEVLFRFKKADAGGRTSNVPTQRALAFHDHEQDLFGLPEVQRVEVVYKLNRLETQISDVCVVARDRGLVAWEYSLLDAGDAVMPLPAPLPQPAQPAASIVKIRGGTNARKNRQG